MQCLPTYSRVLHLESSVYIPTPVVSILEAVLTVSPNKQYRGIDSPTTPENEIQMFYLNKPKSILHISKVHNIYNQKLLY